MQVISKGLRFLLIELRKVRFGGTPQGDVIDQDLVVGFEVYGGIHVFL